MIFLSAGAAPMCLETGSPKTPVLKVFIMDSFTLDCSQLANVDITTLTPKPLTLPPQKALSRNEQSVLAAALKAGKRVNSALGLVEEIVDLARNPIRGTLVAPATMPTLPKFPVLKFSTSIQLTGAVGLGVSAAAGLGIMGSAGVYASTTREIGVYTTYGVALVINSPGASAGYEWTFVLGTPSDFKGPYFGIAVGAGTGTAITGTLLFSPTLPLTNPLELTLMGISFNIMATTPTKLPVTVTLEVTDTKIAGFKF